jgi:DNA-binding GntR family transcriptional regulator
MTLDRRVHFLLAQAASNKFLRSEFEVFYSLSLRIWYLALNEVQPEDIDVEAHLEILKAVEVQDAKLAEQRMRQHIKHFHDAIRLYL